MQLFLNGRAADMTQLWDMCPKAVCTERCFITLRIFTDISAPPVFSIPWCHRIDNAG